MSARMIGRSDNRPREGVCARAMIMFDDLGNVWFSLTFLLFLLDARNGSGNLIVRLGSLSFPAGRRSSSCRSSRRCLSRCFGLCLLLGFRRGGSFGGCGCRFATVGGGGGSAGCAFGRHGKLRREKEKEEKFCLFLFFD